VWVAPSNVPTPSIAKGAIRLEVSADDAEGRRLVEASWSLERTAESYREFMKTFAPLEDWVRAANDIAPADAILARVLLIHHYRRVILRDPLLPASLLPPAWPALEARKFCASLYQALLPASDPGSIRMGERHRPPAAAGAGTRGAVLGRAAQYVTK
jgi:phenylacetic acid degradation operon negative regulatory protein